MEKRYDIDFADSVYNDLRNIPSRIGDSILDQIEHLERFPEMGWEINRESWKGYQLVVEGYRILYKINKEKKLVKIYHIRHGKRNFQ
jgi:mRNA-degrading endonuclease RelE of RelBE toxin-antitoxin system